MNHCYGAEGKPDFEQLKRHMEHCGKHDFSEDEIGMLDMTKMKKLMEKYGCLQE